MFNNQPTPSVSDIKKQLDNSQAIIVDVRSDSEYHAAHADGAMHLSVERIMQGEAPTEDKNKKVYLYCASGGRSSMAEKTLKQQGYDAANIGGLSDWQSAGGKVVRS